MLKNNKGFTLIELMVVVVIIAILATTGYLGFQSYIARAQDATRKTDVEALAQAVNTYKGSHLAPPLNQYGLVGAGLLTSLPTDPSNKKLYQYNADIRGWIKGYASQGSSPGGYLITTNQPLYDTADDVYDGEKYASGKATKTYSTKIKNLKYFGGYLTVGTGDANFLTDSGLVDNTANNKSSSLGGPASAPTPCSSVDSGGAGQLDIYEGDVELFKKKASSNSATLADIYGPAVRGSICKIMINNGGKGMSVVDQSKDLEAATGEATYVDQYN